MLRRGDIVIVVAPGDYGKPRPSLVLQANDFADLPSLTVCLLSSHLRVEKSDVRYPLQPNFTNGLKSASQVAIDKVMTVPRIRVGQRIGHLEADEMAEISALIAVFLGL